MKQKKTANNREELKNRKIDAALTADKGDSIFVALDVHKKTYHVAVWKNGNIVFSWVTPSDDDQIVAALEPARAAIKKVVYEAGPTGYSLARALMKAKFPVGVIAPGKTPRQSNPGNKSDQVDCKKLALYAATGMLSYIAVPTKEEELNRLLVRTRDDMKSKRQRVMRQIKSFLLNYHLPEPEELVTWTKAGIMELQAMELSDILRFRLNELLYELDYHTKSLKRVEEKLRVFEEEKAEEMEILQSHPGVGRVVARQFLAEVYQPERFRNGKELAAYLGLAPRVSQSGQTRREGDMLPGGRRELRNMLIEASWVAIRKDKRMASTYHRLFRNTGNGKKAIAGVARRLAVRLWTMLINREAYRAAG